MTDLLEQAIATVRSLPERMQDGIARMVLLVAGGDQPIVHLSPEEQASFVASLAQMDRREFASDEQVRAVWTKHGL